MKNPARRISAAAGRHFSMLTESIHRLIKPGQHFRRLRRSHADRSEDKACELRAGSMPWHAHIFIDTNRIRQGAQTPGTCGT